MELRVQIQATTALTASPSMEKVRSKHYTEGWVGVRAGLALPKKKTPALAGN
jgi:hypothetical protein